MAKRRGVRKPVRFVRNPDTGHPVENLRLHRSSLRYYRIRPGGKREYYPSRFSLAEVIRVHDAHEAGQRPTHRVITMEIPPESHKAPQLYDAPVLLDVPVEKFWTMVRKFILTQPHAAARVIGIEWLAWGPALKEPPPALKLSEIRRCYQDNKEFADRDELPRSLRIWDEFARTVKVATVPEVTPLRLAAYRRAIGRKYADKTVLNRLNKVGSMLRFAYGHLKPHRVAIADLQEDFRLVADRPDDSEGDPQPIDPQDFHALLAAADSKWRAILLLSLNCALHIGEACSVKREDVRPDGRKWQLRNRRTKKGKMTRVARLWPRTVAAIKAWLASDDAKRNATDCLFCNNAGQKMNVKTTITWFSDVLLPRGGVQGVTFDAIRDGARDAAGEVGDLDAARMLMGQRRDIDEKYARRKASRTEALVAAIEECYFGGQGGGYLQHPAPSSMTSSIVVKPRSRH